MGSSNRSSVVHEAAFGAKRRSEDWRGGQEGGGLGTDVPEAGAASGGGLDADLTVAVLAQAIQHEIIPRLMLAHRTPLECEVPPELVPVKVSEQEVAYFGQLILGRNEKDALACITSMRRQGAPIESIFLDLLAPAARYLGTLWEEDLCDFTDVTVGLGRLQTMLHDLNSEHENARNPTPNGLSVLLVPTPGEQHTFGLAMVAELFRQEGWEVVGGPYDLGESPQTLVGGRRFDVVGFSLATKVGLPSLVAAISAVRKASHNKSVCIMVGGPLFALQPEVFAETGADLLASEARQAPSLVRLHLASGAPVQ